MTTLDADRGAYRRDLSRWRNRSRRVRLARVLLPIAILAILASVGGQVAWRSFTGGDRRPAESKAQIRMISPRFQGQSSDGRPFLITARSAVRDEADLKRVFLDAPTLTLGVGSPVPTRSTADRGIYREDTLKLQLFGNVRMDDGAGYRFASNEAMVDTRTGNITGETTLNGEGPTGQVQSNAYSVYDKGDRIVFRGGVKTRLDRKTGEAAPE
ncbi:LPS export ABC transporter periplasmic protein LptC [Caulobacter sp. DWR2-3-1b2]|uniref:LPS export ABC transporter periplasmic protein LptC n=1 Tax=unclassified Caulobacter TaxID=2648921 RepID=UPI00198E7FF6|nr:LPS export ABC transporter periplasmic protein LptC [Caulobacter sp.]